MSLVWATRGRDWGFRFVLDGGLADPLPLYETAFAGIEDEPEVWRRDSQTVVLRFPDPLGRRDAAGRVIPHEFIATESSADGIHSAEDGRRLIWPVVAERYSEIWELPQPPIN